MRFNLLFAFAVLLVSNGFSQSSKNFFQAIPESAVAARSDAKRMAVPHHFNTYSLDFEGFKAVARQAPAEWTDAAYAKTCRVNLPTPDGSFEEFAIWKTAIMHPDLAAKFPEIMTFGGESTSNPGKTLTLIVSMHGVKAAIRHASTDVDYVEPMFQLETTFYQAYNRADFPFEAEANGVPMVGDEVLPEIQHTKQSTLAEKTAANRGGAAPVELRTFRFAATTTGEYAQDNGGTLDAVLAKVVEHTALASANFERDIYCRLQLIAQENLLIFLDPASDPFSGQVGDYAGQNLSAITVTKNIPLAAFDVAHNYCRYTGGPAAGIMCGVACTLGRTCGCTSGSGSYGDGFVNVIGQEVGHQFTGGHTWNRCGDIGGRNGLTAFEPGSGSTIMSYAGSCGGDNVQNFSDLYYQSGSISEIRTWIEQNENCGLTSVLPNSHPVVTLKYPQNFFIPKSTYFELDGFATDPDGDALTYCWEEMDAGPETPLSIPKLNSAIFRTFKPTATATNRYFPRLQNILNNQFSLVEQLPTYGRDLTFRLTVRDNKSGVSWADVEFAAADNAGPFLVQSPNVAAHVWNVGELAEVKWDPANSQNAPVNAKKVNIRLSTDGGLTYPIMLAEAVENDGNQFVKVPNAVGTKCRVRIDGYENVFFDISDANFKIQNPTMPALSLGLSVNSGQVCLPTKFQTEVVSAAVLGFDKPIALFVEKLPANVSASFSKTNINPGDNSTLEIDLTNFKTSGVFTMEVVAIAGTDTLHRPIVLTTVSNDFSQLALVSPPDGLTGAALAQTLHFNTVPDGDLYDIEIGTSPNFENNTLFFSKTNISVDSLKLTNQLAKATAYFWHVRPKNECGTHGWSDASFFSTLVEDCSEALANDLPKTLSANGTPSLTSEIFVQAPGTVSDVNVKIKGYHAAFKDLDMSIVSPSGKEVPLFKNKCGTISVSFNFTLDNQAPNAFNCPPSSLGIGVRPTGNLGDFTGETVTGKWTLKVSDVTPGAGGGMEQFRLEFCASASLTPPLLVKNNVLQVDAGVNGLVSPDLLLVEDANNSAAQLTYTLLSLPKQGHLGKDGVQLKIGAKFTQQDINEGKVRYYNYGWSKPEDTFRFIVDDSEGGWLGSTTFVIQPTNVSSDEAQGKIGFSVFPNPASDAVSIFFENSVLEDTRIAMFSVAGQLLKTEILRSGEQFISLPINDLPQGIYFLEVANQTGRGVQKLVKK